MPRRKSYLFFFFNVLLLQDNILNANELLNLLTGTFSHSERILKQIVDTARQTACAVITEM